MKKKNKYPINQSPLYKLSNQKTLAKILNINLSTLKSIVARGGKNYKFGSTKNGRSIQIPKSQLLRVHNRINNLLIRIETPDYLVSGVKGRSHVYNAKLHARDVAVAKVDISKFYPSTSSEIVKKAFRKIFKCSNDVADTLEKICTVNNHVPTGSPLSQSLCFVVNAPVFDHINIYSKSRDIVFSLYVDDLTFSGGFIPKHFLSYVEGYLKRARGYRCHKFRTYGKNTEKVITGVVVKSNEIDLKRTQRNEISNLFNKMPYYSNLRIKDDERAIKYFQKLIGHLFSAGQISPRYRQFGYEVVSKRKDLGIKAQNQNTK
ncbi:reverse transcriptase family protein [Marinospirillum sp.]|uniref:reverse transcriptase family protein n=1 Tax=Marinospirillum sp. TaxID=2183934 RepID=UPI00384B3AD9